MIKLDREGVAWYNRSREDADGTRILREVRPDGSVLLYRYGVDGSVIGFTHNGASYYYGKNLFGDIVDIYTATGTKVAHYAYDAWGAHTVENLTTSAIGDLNPFRYRGYYYDDETKLYYLQTRYYDPNVGRFLSPDALAYLGVDGELRGYNLYTYCGNNPVMNVDPTGHLALSIGLLMLIGFCVGAGIGAGTSVVSQFIGNGFSFNGFNWGQFALDTALGGFSGLLSMSTLGAGAMIAANAAIGFVGAVGGHIMNGSDFAHYSTWLDISLSTILGGLTGVLGGAGGLNAGYLNTATKTTGFIRAAGMYDDVLTKAVTGFYKTSGIAKNALRLSHNNLVRQWNKMIVMQAGAALRTSLIRTGIVLTIGSGIKGLVYYITKGFFN